MTPEEITSALTRDRWAFNWYRNDKKVNGITIHEVSFINTEKPPLNATAQGDSKVLSYVMAYNFAKDIAKQNGLTWTGS